MSCTRISKIHDYIIIYRIIYLFYFIQPYHIIMVGKKIKVFKSNLLFCYILETRSSKFPCELDKLLC